MNETRRAYNKTPALQPKFDLDAAKASIKDMQKRGGYNNPFGGSVEEMDGFAQDIVGRLNERFSDLDSREDGWAATPEFARDTLMSRRETATKSGQLMESREIGLGRYSSAEEVYKAATVVQRQLNQMLREISKEFGFPYSDVTQKSLNSMINKVERKNAEGKQYTFMDMKDHTRSNVMMNDWTDIPGVLDALDARNIPYVYTSEYSQVNRVFIDVNKIATRFGKKWFTDYIRQQVAKNNLVRITKKKTSPPVNGTAPIAGGYKNDVSAKRISLTDDDVNRNSRRSGETMTSLLEMAEANYRGEMVQRA